MKYFGIGFNKTGTTTLKECFRILGLLPHADYITSKHLIGDFVNNDFSKIHPFINNYTSFIILLIELLQLYTLLSFVIFNNNSSPVILLFFKFAIISSSLDK